MRTAGHLSSQLADATVVLHLQTGLYYNLNESASFVWAHLDRPTTVRELVRLELEAFDAPASLIEHDSVALLLKMLDAGLIQTEEEE